eukprot:3042649-Alexandrium_andersonii.AAC.1
MAAARFQFGEARGSLLIQTVLNRNNLRDVDLHLGGNGLRVSAQGLQSADLPRVSQLVRALGILGSNLWQAGDDPGEFDL